MKAGTLSKKSQPTLTPRQREIVIAPPGCGKTELLARRLVDAVSGRPDGEAVPAEDILCITFTDQAAIEMKERVKRELSRLNGPNVCLPTICTLHAYCLRELRLRQWKASGTSIHIIDEGRQREFSKASGLLAFNEANEKDYDDGYFREKEEIPLQKVINAAFSKAQGENIRYSKDRKDPWKKKFLGFVDQYIQYKKTLNENGAPDRFLDFNDVLLEAWNALSSGEWERPFSLVFVDEVQDLSTFQLDLISMLVSPGGHICYFGDPQQAIYSFMGARVQKLVSLWKSCDEKNRSFRRINYRSPAHILSILNTYARNRIHIDKEWESFCKNWEQLPSARMRRAPRPDYGIPLTHNEDLDEDIALIYKETRDEELDAVCSMIGSFEMSDSNAILALRNERVKWIISSLKKKRKYIVFDSTGDEHSYYLRFLRAHLRLCRQECGEAEKDGDVAGPSPSHEDAWAAIFPFLLGCEDRMDAYGFTDSLKAQHISPLDLLEGKDLPGADTPGTVPFQERCGVKILSGVLRIRYAPIFRKGLASLKALKRTPEEDLDNKVADWLAAAYAGFIKAGFLPPHQRRQWYTVKGMIKKALNDASLEGAGPRLDLAEQLLKEIDPLKVIRRTGTDRRIVHVLTVHKAKGLGFDNVFMFDANQSCYQSRYSSYDKELDRVFFVGMSRARKRLVFSYSAPEIDPSLTYSGKRFENTLKDMSFIQPEDRE